MSSENILITPIKSLESLPTGRIEWLPAKIHYSGPIRLDEYCVVQDTKGNILKRGQEPIDEIVEISFRGRLLKGKKIKLPNGLKGIVFKDDDVQSTHEKQWQPQFQFSQMIFWERELDFDKNEAKMHEKWLNWPNVAKLIHSPLSNTDIEQLLIAKQTLLAEKAEKAVKNNAKTQDETMMTDAVATPISTPIKRKRNTPTKASKRSPMQSPRKSPRIALKRKQIQQLDQGMKTPETPRRRAKRKIGTTSAEQ